MRAHEDRRVPVPSLRRIALGGHRTDAERLVAAAIGAIEVPLLRHHVGDVRVARVEGDTVSVGAHRDVPVLVADAVAIEGARGAVHRAQVLRAAEDVVEGLAIAERDLVELRDREVREVPELAAVVEALVEARVGADEEVVGVRGIDPERVVVAVLGVARLEDVEGGAAIPRDVHEDIHLVDDVRVRRRRLDLLVVVRAGAARDVAVALRPALTAVGAPIEPALLVARLDRRVHESRVSSGHGEADLPLVALREPGGDRPPGLPTIG